MCVYHTDLKETGKVNHRPWVWYTETKGQKLVVYRKRFS